MSRRLLLTTITLAVALGAGGLARAESYPADNTGRNARDRDSAMVTAGEQSSSQNDVRITQTIRKAVVEDTALSTNAHNVKIITRAGVVTLRGPVRTATEKASIEAKASHVSGVTGVENQLEIAAQ